VPSVIPIPAAGRSYCLVVDNQWCDRVLAAFLVAIVEKVEAVFVVILIQRQYQKKKVVVVYAVIAIQVATIFGEHDDFDGS
jgi:hypothetical protein